MSYAIHGWRGLVSAVVNSCEVIAAAARVSANVESHRVPAAADLETLGIPTTAFDHLRRPAA